jgi:hypothetical protein
VNKFVRLVGAAVLGGAMGLCVAEAAKLTIPENRAGWCVWYNIPNGPIYGPYYSPAKAHGFIDAEFSSPRQKYGSANVFFCDNNQSELSQTDARREKLQQIEDRWWYYQEYGEDAFN